MARVVALTITVLGGLALAACSQTTAGPSNGLALTDSAASGEAAGDAATAAAIGITLDSAAQRKAHEAELRALEHGRTGLPVAWRSGRTRGEVVPGPEYQVNAYNCRDYTQTIHARRQDAEHPHHGLPATRRRLAAGELRPVRRSAGA